MARVPDTSGVQIASCGGRDSPGFKSCAHAFGEGPGDNHQSRCVQWLRSLLPNGSSAAAVGVAGAGSSSFPRGIRVRVRAAAHGGGIYRAALKSSALWRTRHEHAFGGAAPAASGWLRGGAARHPARPYPSRARGVRPRWPSRTTIWRAVRRGASPRRVVSPPTRSDGWRPKWPRGSCRGRRVGPASIHTSGSGHDTRTVLRSRQGARLLGTHRHATSAASSTVCGVSVSSVPTSMYSFAGGLPAAGSTSTRRGTGTMKPAHACPSTARR